MKARLGFSVAVSLQPEILLIDEVLAVGDHAFQNKCHHRMQQLKKAGVILIFVTHSHTQALQLCEKALWMHEGTIRASGPTKSALEEYLAFLESQESQKSINTSDGTDQSTKKAHIQNQFFGAIHSGEDHIENLQVDLIVEDEVKDAFPIHSVVDIHYVFDLKGEVEDLNVSLSIYRNDGVLISTISTLKNEALKKVRGGMVKCRVRIKDMDIAPDQYVLVMSIHQGHSYLFRDVVRQFTVLGSGDVFWGMKDFDVDYRVEESGDMANG
jgi:ABC-type multidrug transport system ATPase subunit